MSATAKGTANLGPVPLRPASLAESLRLLIPTHRPIWIHGKPGVGKTTIVRQVCHSIGYACPHFPPAVTLDPVDVRGIPIADREANQTRWLPPNFWPRGHDWRGVIFVDELPQADKSTQSAFMQLAYGGTLGDYQLPEKSTIVVCGNRQEDRAGTNRVITPLLNRFIHLGLDVSLDDWFLWAANRIHGVVRSFLRFRPECFDSFDPTVQQTAFASPRSWELAGAVYEAVKGGDLLFPLIAGCVGQDIAAQFVAFAKVYGQLPDVEEILKDPEGYAVPSAKAPDVLYALSGALADRMKKGRATVDEIKAFVKYVPRLPDEFAVLCMRDAVARNSTITTHATSWLRSHRDVLVGSGACDVP